MARLAVVLFNLGGPDRLEAVEPFLFNLFSDPAIIRLPQPLRWLVANLVSRRRAPTSREMYRAIGGGSPLLPLSQAQGEALQAALGSEARVFIAMRYWHPFSDAAAAAVKAYAPDEVVLLPLYPQFSTTTTASSLAAWRQAAANAGITAPTRTLCCYPSAGGFIAAHVALIRKALGEFAPGEPLRLLLSAHGLPEKVVAAGDPYQWQVERTAAAIVAGLGVPGLDAAVCYQSRVGPLRWIGPDTEHEIARAGAEGRSLLVAPIAFVSEHSETLVELDMTYRDLARAKGVPRYVRVPALATHPAFIGALAELVGRARGGAVEVTAEDGGRLCPPAWRGCAQAMG